MSNIVKAIPQDILIHNIMSHLFPPDLVNVMKTCSELRYLIKKNKNYIDSICQHIKPHGKFKQYYKGKNTNML